MRRDGWEWLSRALAVVRRRSLDREFDEEFATHLALLTDEHERRGLPREEARRRAILQMGGLNSTRQCQRESRGLPRLERALEAIQAVGKDLRHAARSLARARAFTLVCVISLGIGMGSFVALVTFIRALTAPARGVETSGLVELLVRPQGPLRSKAGVAALDEWSYPDFQALREADTGLAITGWATGYSETGPPSPDAFDREAGQEPQRAATFFVSANYFTTLGVSLARGAGFGAADDRPTAAPHVVISDGYWRNRLGSDPDIVGKTLTLDGIPHEVVGITPAEFRGHFNALDDEAPRSVLFVPLERHPRLRADANGRQDRTLDWVHIHGRLAPGADIAQADARVSATMADLSRNYPATNEFKAGSVEPYYSQGAANRGEMRRVAATILGLAGVVLLMVCVNLSGMMLVRGAARERELSIREAVGASRGRLIQYLFFEAVWLAAIGGGLSVMVLFGLPAAIARSLGTTVPPEIGFDVPAVVITAGLCLAVSLVLGLLPALRLSLPNLIPALNDEVAGGGRRVSRVHRTAAAIQVAIAVPFLVISGVMLDRVRVADFGFDTTGLVAARIDAASHDGNTERSLRGIQAALEEASGVLSVTMGDGMPIDFAQRGVRVSPSDAAEFVTAHVTRVAEGFLDTLGAPLLMGRSITLEDRLADARVAVISESLASRLFRKNDVIGEQVIFALDEGREEAFTVIGVSGDFATSQLTTERPQALLPLSEKPASAVYLIARGEAADGRRLTAAFESLGRDFDLEFLPGRLGVFNGIVTGDELVRKSLADLVSESLAVAVAGGIVLVLASLGVLGVIAFMVATRTREIAVRMALGATGPQVMRLTLSDVVTLVLPGVAVGLLIGAVLIRTMDSVMGTPLTVGAARLGAVEPLIYVAAASIALVVALMAGLPAARRAASIQPMAAMRSE